MKKIKFVPKSKIGKRGVWPNKPTLLPISRKGLDKFDTHKFIEEFNRQYRS